LACDEAFCGWQQKKHVILWFQILNCKGGVAIKGFGLQLRIMACNHGFRLAMKYFVVGSRRNM
jgi:hypothetical protein